MGFALHTVILPGAASNIEPAGALQPANHDEPTTSAEVMASLVDPKWSLPRLQSALAVFRRDDGITDDDITAKPLFPDRRGGG